MNIANTEHQEALSAMLPDESLFIIDNLSTAQLGMEENDNDSFDLIRDWLLSLRHRAITVMIVHHAGRNGAMRGSSRREDMAHWIVALKDASDDDASEKVFGNEPETMADSGNELETKVQRYCGGCETKK